MAEFLLELLSEEIPARLQGKAADDLKRLVCDGLKKAGLNFARADAFTTPRRLALVVDGLPAEQPDVREERKGPKADAPDKAIEGFLRSVGLTRDQVEQRDTPKGPVLFAVIEKKGRAAAEVLGDVVLAALNAMPWSKSMKWGAGSVRWVRPLHGILALFDGAVVAVEFAGVRSGAATVGHRFHAPDWFDVAGFADYRDKLRGANVLLDAAERRDIIRDGAERLAQAEGLAIKTDDALLAEVAGLVEWPVPLMGRIDDDFMALPPEVLTASMRAHQKYFSLESSNGDLAARFIVVANLDARDGGQSIVAGNERVLRARLADAKFFWDQDRKSSLESRLPALEKVIFHAKLGTVAERVKRIEASAGAVMAAAIYHSKDFSEPVDLVHGEMSERAAMLAKADLATGMVAEFPELQGVMGRYYALSEGVPKEVADAIAEHYSPLGPNDVCPSAPVSVAVALADKLDTLVGFFVIDEKPTGSKDPFALRRAALGFIRLILQNDVRLRLRHAITLSTKNYATTLQVPIDEDAVFYGLMDFFKDRLKVHLREDGVPHDHIEALFAFKDDDDLVLIVGRIRALGNFLASEDGMNLLAAYKRATNILRIEEKKDGETYQGPADVALLTAEEEISLHKDLTTCANEVSEAFGDEDYVAAMSALAKLRRPVDAFFENVTVNADDAAVRRNRLLLLSQTRAALASVADFSKIEG